MFKKTIRLISAVCAVCMLLAAVPSASFAAENEITCGEFTFTLTAGGKAELTRYSGKYRQAAVPAIADGNEVTKILDGAFSGADIDYVVIPDTVTEIGTKAFENCKLYEIRYAGSEADWNKITGIDGNEDLKDVTVNYNVTPVNALFDDDRNTDFDGTALTCTVDFEYCYRDCTAIIQIIHNGDIQKEFTQNVQIGAENLEFSTPVFPSSNVYEIEITFVNNLTDMTEYCSVYGWFDTPMETQTDGDYNYSVIQISGVTGADITDYSGDDREITIPETLGGYKVISVSEYAFSQNHRLENIILPQTLIRIAYGAFFRTDIESIDIPASVEIIEDGAFDGCHNLASIYLASENQNYCVKDSVLYTNDMTELICYAPQKTDSEFEIPGSVTKLGNSSFARSDNLKSLKIPDSVTVINTGAFRGTGIETFSISQYVKSIGDYAFASGYTKNIFVDENNPNYADKDGVLFDKSGKTLIRYPNGRNESCYEVPEGTEIISYDSLDESRLKAVIIPGTITKIERFAMEDGALKTVLYKGTEDDWYWMLSSHNTALDNAQKVFEYDGALTVSGKMSNCFYDGKTVTANIEFNYIFEDCNAILTVYDGSGRLAFKKITRVPKGSRGISLMCPVSSDCKDYTAKVFFLSTSDILKPLGKAVTGTVGGEAVLESAHPYDTTSDEMQEYTYDGECTSLSVTFSDDTYTSKYVDYIYIYDKDGTEIGEYTGGELSGQTVTVPGNTVKIRLLVEETEIGDYNYGYRTTSITVNK